MWSEMATKPVDHQLCTEISGRSTYALPTSNHPANGCSLPAGRNPTVEVFLDPLRYRHLNQSAEFDQATAGILSIIFNSQI